MKNRGKSRNGGYSIVTTLVAISFVTVLGVIVLSVSSVNLRMKYMDQKARADFYQGETVLDDIYNGIGMDVASAVSQSYAEIVRNASNGVQVAYDTEEEAYEAFLASLTNRLDMMFVSADGGLTEVDLAARMEQYIRVNADSGISEAEVSVPALPDDRIKQEKDKSGNWINYIFRDVSVAYRDGKGNQSTLTADIVVDFPYIDFFRKHDNIFDYALAANQGIYLNGNVTINGNIYAGTAAAQDLPEYGERDVYGGINLSQGTNASIHAKYIVTKGNITVRDGASLQIAGIGGNADRANIWAETLRTANQGMRNTQPAKISILANTYLANDLELNSNWSEVTLEGAYYGFNNKTYVTNEGKKIENQISSQQDHSKSSSILVNGRNCRLDLKGLDTLMVAGRGYLDFVPSQPIYENVNYTSREYATGESMGFRSDQFIWLAPAEYLNCPNPASWDTLESLFPGVAEADLAEHAVYREADGTFAGGWFGSMLNMIDNSRPVEVIKIGRGGSAVYYFYLNFLEGKKKEYLEYIIAATDSNPEDPYVMQAFAMKEKMQQRIFEDTANSIEVANMAECRVYGLGSMIRTVTGNGNKIESVAGTASGSGYAQALGIITLENAVQTGIALNSRYTWMTGLLDAKEEYPVTADLGPIDSNDYLARVYKDPAGLQYDSNSSDNSPYLPLSRYVDFYSIRTKAVKSEADKDAVVTKDDYTVTSNCKGIILSAGNVTVKSGMKVEGLILAAGKIYLENNAQVISDRGYAQVVLDRMLKKPDAATDVNNISLYFVDYKPVSRESITVDTMSNEYLNWMSYRNFRKG